MKDYKNILMDSLESENYSTGWFINWLFEKSKYRFIIEKMKTEHSFMQENFLYHEFLNQWK